MMDVITRYYTWGFAPTAVAGVYSTSTTIALTPKFNLILKGVGATFSARDATTSQFINGGGYLQWSVEDRDNPAFDRSGTYKILYISVNNQFSKIPLHLEWTDGVTETIYFRGATDTVTANNITHYTYFWMEYLCPKDYLSVDPFNISV